MMLLSVALSSCLFVLCHQGFCSSAAELSVMTEREVKVLSASETYPHAVLSCDILPANLSVRARWILPNGHILAQSDGRFLISIGATDIGRSSILVIPNLSYKDAGLYTCEAMRTEGRISACDCNGFPVSSSIELILEASIESLTSDVKATEGTSVSLECEMKGYIRADEDMQWFKGDRRIYDGTYKRFFITFTDGTPCSAQNGSNMTVPSRISVLKISSATVSDSGLYSCKLHGHRVQSYISLDVMETLTVMKPTSGTHELYKHDVSPYLNTTANESTKLSSLECRAEVSRVVAITLVCSCFVTAILSILLTSVVLCLYYKLNLSKSKVATKSETPHTEQASPTCQNGQGEFNSSGSTNVAIG